MGHAHPRFWLVLNALSNTRCLVSYRLFRATYTQGGKTKEAKKWYVEFRDHLQTVRRLAGFTSKSATDELGRNLVRLVEYHGATGGQVDPALSRWLAGLASGIREKLVAIGLLDGVRHAAAKPLGEHISDWKAALVAKANTADHVAMVTGRAKRVFNGCGYKFYSDLAATRIQSFLNTLRTGTEDKQGISAQTFNFHLAAVKQFCRWMVKHGRATSNPVDPLEPLNVKVDRRRDRRALTVEELVTLLTTTAAGPKRGRMTGPERALLYRVAMETGLRSNELRTLTARSFDLNPDAPTVTVMAGNSKNRKEDTLPIRPDLATEVRAHLSGKPADAQVFPIPKDRKCAAKMFRADVDAAGIVFRDAANEVVDFHALRHTFVTNLARGKVHPKIAQALARHSTISLTMDRYTHTDLGEQADALKVLPSLLAAPGAAPVVLASCLASIHAKQGTPVDSDGRSDKTRGHEDEPTAVPEKQGEQRQNEASGSVWKSNPLGALFTPPTGFEDLGRHQPCKHSQATRSLPF